MSNIFKLIISIIICEGVGIVAGIATSKSIGDWYQFLNKPSFNPPGWIFGPVWTVFNDGYSIFSCLERRSGYSRSKNCNDIFHYSPFAEWSLVFCLLFVAFTRSGFYCHHCTLDYDFYLHNSI